MQNLAIELLEQIFTLACIDGGYTGCSLSLVSRDISATSRSARFHSISHVSGTAQQLAQFLRCYHKQRAAAHLQDSGGTPTIRHLCIAPAQGNDVKKSWCIGPTYAVDPALDAACEAQVEQERLRYMSDLIAFIQHAAPTLYTFSLVHWQGWQTLTKLSNIEGAGFPMLQELTITGPHPFVHVPGGCSLPLYPRLTRLHLIDIWGSTKDVLRWADADLAPHVTHLRLSAVQQVSEDLRAFLASKEKTQFPDLTRIWIQPIAPPPTGGKCGNPYIAYGSFMTALRNLYSSAVLPVEHVPHRESSGKTRGTDLEESTKREWLDRLQGGPGCWTGA